MKNQHIKSITASLPATVRKFTWVRNHHYVEVEDEKGNKAKLHAGGLLRGVCTSVKCGEVNFAGTIQGAMVCTHCLAPVNWRWTKMQLAFLPEQESNLLGFDAPREGKAPLTLMQRAWLIFYTAITNKAPKASSAPSPEAAEIIPEPMGDDEKTPAGSRHVCGICGHGFDDCTCVKDGRR